MQRTASESDSSYVYVDPSLAVAGNVPPSLSSSGLVVGPLASVTSAAPAGGCNATPPSKPFEGENPTKTFVETSCNTVNTPLLSFTPKTCIELLSLLSPEQLDFEFKVFCKISKDSSKVPKVTRNLTDDKKREFIEHNLKCNLMTDYENVVDTAINYIPSTHGLFSRNEADMDTRDVGEMHRQRPATAPDSELVRMDSDCTLPPAANLSDTGKPPVRDPVCFYDISFESLTLDEVTKAMPFERIGAREVAYFGSRDYSYGQIKHAAQDYPDTPFFGQIFDTIQSRVPNFTRNNYTCLVTLYEGGQSYINQHADNELSIVPESDIYTISLGSSRTIKFVNTSGRLDIRHHKLEHGSLYSMPAKSQSCWTHGIEPEPSVSGARVSLTFRMLSDTPPPPRVRAPPVRKPGRNHPAEEVLKPHCPPPGVCGRDSKRVLFLTDSILNRFQPHMFRNLTGYTCIKKTNYDLVNFYNYQKEFGYSDVVILSGGINDIARNGHSAESLADIFFARLEECARMYPDTMFVVNSMIWTKQKYFNNHIDRFNGYLAEFCINSNLSNVLCFDSHNFIRENRHKITGSFYDVEDVNGIHVAHQAWRLIGNELVRFVKHSCASPGTFLTGRGAWRRPNS